MKQEVIYETIEYRDGKRVATITTRNTMNLSDDLTKQAIYQSKLAVCQQVLEKSNGDDEKARLKGEIATLQAAIKIQQGYIDSYPTEAG